MAVIRSDGTITHNPRYLERPAMCGRVGDVRATLAELEHLFGPTDTIEDAEPEWVIRVESPDGQAAERVSLYYLGTAPRICGNSLYTWGIGAHRSAMWAVERLTSIISENHLPRFNSASWYGRV